MQYSIFCFLALMVSCTNGSSDAKTCDTEAHEAAIDTTAECQGQRAVAIADFKGGSTKYYFYGIAHPSKEVVRKFKELGITVVAKGCAPEKTKLCYNQFVDSIMFAEYRVRVSTIK